MNKCEFMNYDELFARFIHNKKQVTIKYIELVAIIVLLVLSVSESWADTFAPDPYWQGTLGPLNIRSLSPGQALRLAPLPRSPYGLPDGETELQFHIAAASVYLRSEGEYLIDFNFIDTRLAINHGFSDSWSTELSFNDRRIKNLYLDEVVESFHDVFGIEQNGRDINQNETHIVIPGYSANFANELDGVFSQTLGFSIQKVLIDKSVEWPAVAIIFNTGLEILSGGMIEKGAFDYGLQLTMAQKQSSGYMFANLSYTRFGSEKTLEVIPLTEKQFSGMFGYEFTMTGNEAFIVQYLFSEGVLKDLGALDKVSHEIHFGYKWRTENNIIEVGLVENIVNFDNGPDVAFTFGVTRRI
ncbi:MAG: hypothetical protein DIZ80_10695 [endosymbiont of Galathealinum brachiosum]|uniref:DUF3187 domain-containing protein n=1 Tax=endosymbiont of Galathealinum brachiosum TaxID=2200906 RepID=A0A370DCV8_9GAMM|nr:MAG: hypothetical protein DIZ80_10695 [endosymbiont of Galathealinum brachiosum]